MQSSNGHNILGGFGICPQENFRHRESSEMQINYLVGEIIFYYY